MSYFSSVRLRDGREDYLITAGAMPVGYEMLDAALAAWTLRRWFREQRLDRYRQCDLYWAINPITSDVSRIGHAEMQRWLEARVVNGSLRIACRQHASTGIGRTGGSPPSSLAMAQEARAAALGATVPTHATPAVIADAGMPYAVYLGSGSADPLPDKDDADAENPSCPNPYHRSETLESASFDVRRWLDANEKRGEIPQRRLLGGFKGAGGGFLQGTTEVVTIPAGTRLWRYIDTSDKPWGGWWFFHPYEGDPRAFAALPPTSSGNVLVQGEAKLPLAALCGPGAPRCTNKPGGPPQLCIPYSPSTPGSAETAFIHLV